MCSSLAPATARIFKPSSTGQSIRTFPHHLGLWKDQPNLTRHITASTATLSNRGMAADWNAQADFFRYTRGRFTTDEKHNLECRNVKFDMNQLARIAASSVGAKECVAIEKCADGMYNKAYSMTMDNGRELVAKVPNPNAGEPHFTTASEVATMDFVSYSPYAQGVGFIVY